MRRTNDSSLFYFRRLNKIPIQTNGRVIIHHIQHNHVCNPRHIKSKTGLKNPKQKTSGSQKLPIDFLGNMAYNNSVLMDTSSLFE